MVFPHGEGQRYSSPRNLLIAVGICILILISFVLLHLMVHNDLRILVPAYLLSGPSLAIIEIAYLSVLIIPTCDSEIIQSSTAYKTNIGLTSVRRFLCYPRGLAHIFSAMMVMLSVVLSEYSTSSSTISNQQTHLYARRSLSLSDTHHANLRNASQYYHLPFQNSFQCHYYASVATIVNNSIQHNVMDNGKAAARNGLTKQNNKINNVYINRTRNEDTRGNSFSLPQLVSPKLKGDRKNYKMQQKGTKNDADILKDITSEFNELLRQNVANVVMKSNISKKEIETMKNGHLKYGSKFNSSNNTEIISWPHVLPIWKHVMNNLAANTQTNENGKIVTQNVIKRWQNTLLGMLAIILFAAFFVQLSLLITTFTTLKVVSVHFWVDVHIHANAHLLKWL